METTKIKIGDIVQAKYGNSAIPCDDGNGKRSHINIGIWGIVTDIANEDTKQEEILVKIMFDATSTHTYKPEDLVVICSTNLIKVPQKTTEEILRKEFWADDICMFDFLAGFTVVGLSFEEAFEMYISSRKWADHDRFYLVTEESGMEELGEDNDHCQFNALIQCRFSSKIDIKEQVEKLGRKVLSIKEAEGTDDTQSNGIPNPDHSLIIELDAHDDEYSRLQVYYYIDRRGQIVISDTYLG